MKLLTKHIFDNNVYLAGKVGITTLWDRLRLKFGASKHEASFKNIETCCFFIGYPRSGHSIISSVMDAHPNCLIAHRMDSIRYFEMGYKLLDIFYLMLRNSERFGKSNRKLTAYEYNIPNQWQGRFSTLKVIGDQEGKWSTLRLANRPEVLEKLLQIKTVKLRFIHVIRNPFDNISTWALRTADDIDSRTLKYFDLVEKVASIQKHLAPEQILNIRHEEFIKEPEKWIKTIFNFIDLEIDTPFIKDCTSIIFQKENKSRNKVKWSLESIEKVENKMKEYPFFDGYSFHS